MAKEVSEKGLAKHIGEEILLGDENTTNGRGKLVFAVRDAQGNYTEISDGDSICLECKYASVTGGVETSFQKYRFVSIHSPNL